MLSIFTLLLLPSVALSSTNIYLYSRNKDFSSLTSLSQFLELDVFDSPLGYGEEVVLGQPAEFVSHSDRKKRVLLLSVDGNEDVVPQSLDGLKPVRMSSNDDSLKLLQRYASLASKAYSAVHYPTTKHDTSSTSIQAHPRLQEMKEIQSFTTDKSDSRFGAFRVTRVRHALRKYGEDSLTYRLAVKDIELMIRMAILADYDVAVLIPSSVPTHQHAARQQPSQSPFPVPPVPDTAPIFSTSTCFSSENACKNATSDCSSRGSCVVARRAGRECFVCNCGKVPLKEGGRNVTWAGDMCQKVDISLQFSLLGGTVIFLVIVVVGSIALLRSVGDVALPGTLTATAAGHLKRD